MIKEKDMEEEQVTITVNLQDVLDYINSEDFINYIFNTTDISIGLFITETLKKTIEYMLTDAGIQI